MEKLHIPCPVIVEGKYDKITLSSVIDAKILPTGGFSVFNNKEKAALFRRLAEKTGVIVLTDPDGGGRQIRAYLSQILPKEKIYHLYVPALPGKEKRKPHPSRAGTLGVEGIDAARLRALFAPFASGEGEDAVKKTGGITKTDLYLDGLSGRDNAAAAREALCRYLDLPTDMTAPALLDALNLLYTREEYKGFLTALAEQNKQK